MGMGRTVRMRKRKSSCLPAWTAYHIFNCAITNVLHNSETSSTVSTVVRTARPQTVDEIRNLPAHHVAAGERLIQCRFPN
jgi:hypothetical protein